MSETKKPKKSTAFWVVSAVWFTHVIGFLVSDLRDDTQGMIWFGFMGMMWFVLADRERNA